MLNFRIKGWNVFTNIRNQPFENKYVFHADFGWATLNNLGQAEPQTLKMVTGEFRRRDILDCDTRPCQGIWKQVNYRISPDWNLANQSHSYVVNWAEVDAGKTTVSLSASIETEFEVFGQPLTLGVTLFEFEYVGAEIVPLGSQRVYYCDPIMKLNDTGSIQFRSN